MGFNPDNYDLKKLSEYPQILFGNDLPDAAFMPVVSIDENDALANYKIRLAQLRDYIIQNGDYTNVIDYRPEHYAVISNKQLTIPAGWRLECPNGFLPTGEFQNSILEITEDRVIEFAQQPVGNWIVAVTPDNNYLCLQDAMLVRKSRASVIAPTDGALCYETTTNLWYRWTGSDWQQIAGMPLLNVAVAEDGITVSLCNSLMRNRLNFEFLLAQAGFEIPETRGPFERIVTNVKKSGADLLYYIPAHTEANIANYPDTLDLIRLAHARAVNAGQRTQTIGENSYNFYYDEQTGLYFAATNADYENYFTNLGLAPFIFFDGAETIKTPLTSHGELVAKWQMGVVNNIKVRVYADGWVEQEGQVQGAGHPGYATVDLPVEMKDDLYNISLSVINGLNNYTNTVFGFPKQTTTQVFMRTGSNGTNSVSLPVAWKVQGYAAPAALANIPNAYSRFEYYLLGNAATNIPADLSGQLATILNNYNQIVQNGADFFSIQATDDADAKQKSIKNPTKFVYVADAETTGE